MLTNEQRVRELMKHFKITSTKLATYLDLSEKTFSFCLNNKRTFAYFELRKIAEYMGITLDRLLMKDTVEIKKELDYLISKKENFDRVLHLVGRYSEISLGTYEKCDAIKYLGAYYLISSDYRNAEECFKESYDYALKYGYKHNIRVSLINLIYCHNKQEDFMAVRRIIEVVEKNGIFSDNKDGMMGTLFMHKGMAEESMKRNDLARKSYLASIYYYRMIGDKDLVGRVVTRIAHIEMADGNLLRSKVLYKRAIKLLKNSSIERLSKAEKCLAEVLNMLDEKKEAKKVINRTISAYSRNGGHNSELRQELHTIEAIIANDTNKATYILANSTDLYIRAILAGFIANDSVRPHNLNLFSSLETAFRLYFTKTRKEENNYEEIYFDFDGSRNCNRYRNQHRY